MRLAIYVVSIMMMVMIQFPANRAEAHSQSYGYLDIRLNAQTVSGRFEAAVRDLDRLYRLDSNGDGAITWAELRQREAAVGQAALQTLSLVSLKGQCNLTMKPMLIDNHGGETYAVIPFTSNCDAAAAMTLNYNFLSGLDARHRGLATLTDAQGRVRNFVMATGERNIALGSGSRGWMAEMASFAVNGFHHILIGYDHILFVLTLLIGTAMLERGRSTRETFLQTAKVITAFTLSHSVTLGLAALGFLVVPTALAESLIAATIAIAAINNIWPFLTSRLWLVALVFGLIHGVGFANVLAGIGLPQNNLLPSLLAFNIGVEVGQLAIVVIALPLIMLVARQHFSRIAMPMANCAITALALLWLSDRVLGTGLMPF